MTHITLISLVFVIGYLLITLENILKINKTATALLTGAFCWTIYALFTTDHTEVHHHLTAHLSEAAAIIFFLLGAMTIVELVDAFQGFRIITDRITTRDARALLWIIGLIAFFLSAALDNLTTAIVMVSLLRKLLNDEEKIRLYAGVVVIAANAGGAWSPMGDVTTTMLWIGGQISPTATIQSLIIPSLVALFVPLLGFSISLKGKLEALPKQEKMENNSHSVIMLIAGLGSLLFVPIFKTITHLPPYLGVLLGLGLVWIIAEFLNRDKDEEDRQKLSAAHALSRIDSSSVLFFLGILLAIGVLQSTHILSDLAKQLNTAIGNMDVIVLLIGMASAVVDNVPLVAASMGMYDLQTYPIDHKLWQFLAYCAGTGGSMLIIGSAAGVAVMGIAKIDFFWYLRHISFWALAGYLAGAGVYLVLITH
jgi:Na+/H+ antiporter NhaD/arsenite permease-like protein